ncbi:hypothetical protein [Dolichospermum phage Dfl-JY23]
MKIQPAKEPINFVMPDSVPDQAIEEQQSVAKENASVSELTGVIVDEVITPSGKEAIAFESPISGLRVVVLVPETEHILAIERDIVRKHRDSGAFEQSVVFLSHLIVEYGDRKGEKVMGFDKLIKLQRKELTAINVIANEFFRLGEI